MNKTKLIFISLIILLVLLSSNVFAVTRTDFEAAITSFVKSTPAYNDRFLKAEDNGDDAVRLGYNNRTVWSDEINDTALYFTDDSFIAYVYKEVLGLDMQSGGKIYTDDQFVTNKGKLVYFDAVFDNNGDGIGEAYEIGAYGQENGFNMLRPGDILVENHKGDPKMYMYIGNSKFVRFDANGNVTIGGADWVDNKKYFVSRISDKALANYSIKHTNIDQVGIETGATTIKDSIKALNLSVSINDNTELNFSNSNGSVSIAKIKEAITEGIISEYGINASLKYLKADIEYKSYRSYEEIWRI